jgi:excisionase family DNA binding protein
MEPIKLLTIEEFATITRVHPKTVKNMIKSGRLVAVSFGSGKRGTYRIQETEVARIFEMAFSDVIEKIVDRRIDEKMEKRNG